ncbi:FAD-dependent oxidoreductase [Gluconacetobacter azotocaptans]|uniref:FAD-dependent oxidoreductase n=1 Tax=Gluconacetobacter azotocaptans TaxID=142834 RepID=A0A7W4JT97_9PROT|nr:FAD-dependent monooxygenase [Gluconacetobacter azotocaptans]MBB2190447.1 FAD-dependent oxidoreductase [Gluconacetobacter azotocaptans]GBQ30250.1 FAD-binding monooxygenase protein [Gluconacetobacter azotocaptans DSM 13594]
MSQHVMIVGAGPVGMVCALALGRQGISVTVVEREPGPVMDQRAASLHPPTIAMLADLGIADTIISKGLIAPNFQYHDRVAGEIVAEFDLGLMKDEFRYPFVLQYEQYKLTDDVSTRYADEIGFAVRFSTEATDIVQKDDHVLVTLRHGDEVETMRVDYLIGADGGRSTVRKSQDIAFEGFTYDECFVKIATPFDFGAEKTDYAFRNYFSDPTEWCNLFKVRGADGKGLWRAIFPTRLGETEDEALSHAGLQARLQKFFPKEGEYDIAYSNMYAVNQRVAATFRRGRVLLAGDSAHVNNPIGGMGMNGGIHDAVNLCGKLGAVLRGEQSDDVLDLYSRQRRHAATTFVQAQSIQNKRLLEERDPAVRAAHLSQLRATAADPERARAFMRRASLQDSLTDAQSVT